jgi:CheY-like chemotaxis protein
VVVEDDDELRGVVCELLEDAGFRTRPAADGTEAVTVLERGGEEPCLILLDLMMPGMDGWTFRRWQQASAHAAVPVVVISAVLDGAKQAAQLDAAGFLGKPIRLEALLESVERYCGAPG